MLNYRLITGPVLEPVTLAQARLQCGFGPIEGSDRLKEQQTAELLRPLITAARQYAEKYTQRSFFNQTWELALDAFPAWNYKNGTVNPAERKGWPFYSTYWDPLAIRLPWPRCLQVNSIVYRDLTNTPQTLSASTYYVDNSSEPARVVPMPAMTWPTTQLYVPGSVRVNYTAASFVNQISENFTVPANPGPYTYKLLQSPVVGVLSVVDGSGNPIAFTQSGQVLTFDASQTGKALTVTYCTPNLPQTIYAALLLMIRHLYDNPSAVVDTAHSELPLGVKALLDMERFEQFTYETGY